MNIIIFGAAGRTGQRLIKQAKARSHRVTAFARRPGPELLADPAIRVIQGNLLDADAVARATEGQEVIFSAVGAPAGSGRAATTLFSQGMKHLVAGARLSGANRIIAVGSSGIDPEVRAVFPLNFLAKLVVGPMLRGIYDDLTRMEEWLAAGGELDWTVMRPPYLTEGRLTTRYRMAVNRHLPGIARISRADLAHAMLGSVTEKSTYRAWLEIAY